MLGLIALKRYAVGSLTGRSMLLALDNLFKLRVLRKHFLRFLRMRMRMRMRNRLHTHTRDSKDTHDTADSHGPIDSHNLRASRDPLTRSRLL
jgi:hypothetical protein